MCEYLSESYNYTKKKKKNENNIKENRRERESSIDLFRPVEFKPNPPTWTGNRFHALSYNVAAIFKHSRSPVRPASVGSRMCAHTFVSLSSFSLSLFLFFSLFLSKVCTWTSRSGVDRLPHV